MGAALLRTRAIEAIRCAPVANVRVIENHADTLVSGNRTPHRFHNGSRGGVRSQYTVVVNVICRRPGNVYSTRENILGQRFEAS